MIEKGFKKWRIGFSPLARRLAIQVNRINPGTWIVLIVIIVVAIQYSAKYCNQQGGHREDIATAIGSIGFFYGTPKPDHSGSRVLYVRTSQNGVGLFISDLDSGKKRLLNEWHVGSAGLNGCDVCPFSPDDKFFAYRFNSVDSLRYLAICRTDSGKELIRMETSSPNESDASSDWIATEGTWLTDQKFAWIKMKIIKDNEPRVSQIHLIERHPDETWTDWAPNVLSTNASCLVPLSDNTIAWLDDGGIYAMNSTSGNVVRLFDPAGRRISEIDYSKRAGQFLMTLREGTGYSVWRLKLRANAPDDLDQLASDTDIQRAQWINGGSGYAYLNQNILVVKPNIADISTTNLKQADVDAFSVASDAQHLFILGIVGNDLGVGLWRYDLATGSLTNVIPSTDYQSNFAVRMDPIHCIAPLGHGQSLSYYIYFPAHFNRHKKYPLLIGDTFFRTTVYQGGIHGFSWAEAMAACGMYVVVIDRKSWILSDPDDWGRDIMSIYNDLIPDPTIDSRKVYLYAVSAETFYMSKFLEEKPELWKGAILLNPTELPDLSAAKLYKPFPKILISAGTDEGESERFERYQENACGHGVMVEVAEHQNAGHVLASIAAVRDRIRIMEKFVFAD